MTLTRLERKAPEASKTLDRGLRLLECLALPEARGGLTITELAARLGVGRPVVYRLVATLEEHRFVTREPGGRVRIGLGIRRIASAVTPIVRAESRPVLRELADAVGATAHLTVAEGDEALALLVVEPSWTEFHVAYRSGSRHPLDQGAAGRAILVGRAGRSEVVETAGELESGAYGLAMPVPTGQDPGDGSTGLVEASVGVVSLAPLEPTRRRDAEEHLVRAARALAAVLR